MSPHNQGPYQTLVGDLDAQGDGRNPQMTRQDMGLSKRGGEVEAGWDQCPCGVAGEGRSSISRGTLQESEDQGEMRLVFPLPNQFLGSLLGSRAWSSTLRGPLWLHGCQGHRKEGGGGKRRGRWGEPSRTRGSGEAWLAFPPPTLALGRLLGSRQGPPPSMAPCSHVDSRGVGEKKRRGRRGGALWIRGSWGSMPSIFPTHSSPGSLLGSWAWSSALRGQRHSRGSPATLSLSSGPHPPRAFSGHVGPKPRPRLPHKPCLCLSPIPYSQGLFGFFSVCVCATLHGLWDLGS